MYLDAYHGRVVASTAGFAAGFVGFCSAHLVDLDPYQDRAAASVAKVVLAVVVLAGASCISQRPRRFCVKAMLCDHPKSYPKPTKNALTSQHNGQKSNRTSPNMSQQCFKQHPTVAQSIATWSPKVTKNVASTSPKSHTNVAQKSPNSRPDVYKHIRMGKMKP